MPDNHDSWPTCLLSSCDEVRKRICEGTLLLSRRGLGAAVMIKWLLVIVFVSIVAGLFEPLLRRWYPRGAPGELRFRIGGREIRIALGMTILLSLLATLLLRKL